MSTPVTFATLPNGRIEALIGNTLVGVIEPWERGVAWQAECIVIAGDVEATMKMLLPIQGAIEMASPMMSVAGARRTLLHRLADWHEQSDPIRYSQMIKELRMQAEGERG